MMDALLARQLAEKTVSVDQQGEWPVVQLQGLATAGVLGWVIPRQYGGSEISHLELLQGYDDLAAACLTTAFILTQRNGACQRIAACQNDELKQMLLPDLASGRTFATVGISHLTTSRQHIKTPAIQAEIEGDEIVLNGTIPWVTGAAFAQTIVTGGTCGDGRQVLVALPTHLQGVEVQAPSRLMAMSASHTATVVVNQVRLPLAYLIAGPVESVMTHGSGGGTGSLTTSVLALGLSRRIEVYLRDQARLRLDLSVVVERLSIELAHLSGDLYAVALTNQSEAPPSFAADIRQRANSLVMRITQAALGVSKGAGFVQGHPVELAAREAMFFQVWSCPQPVVLGVLEELSFRRDFT
ncbi:acyl-CoA dehydrogenase family protein [Planctomicrobium sp. SH527]|uniref:acyl-CoA dehydrogenase family protein n=1 Tax=Planctomicrobium sp. SH527 TaxID=3448123 RepID=UPI003F5B20EC